MIKKLLVFLVDYGERHAHPANAFLHLIGVPMVIGSMYLVYKGQFIAAITLFLLGYLLQYLGHKAQGNEVGEITLLKHLWKHLQQPRGIK